MLALAATQQYFLLSEVATRILPALCHLTTDPEKAVRDNVFRTIKGFLGKLEKVSEDPALRESMGASLNTQPIFKISFLWFDFLIENIFYCLKNIHHLSIVTVQLV